MNTSSRFFGALLLGLLLLGQQAVAQTHPARSEAHWVASWAAAPQDHAQAPAWGAPVPPVPPVPPSLADQTLRLRLQPTLGGQRVRVRFSNRFGKVPLHVAAAGVAISTGGASVSPATQRELRFGGHAGATIAPGQEAWSDAVRLRVGPERAVAVSYRIDAPVPFATVHHITPGATWITSGNGVRRPVWHDALRSSWNHIVTGLEVERSAPVRIVVAFGDSITEGAGIEDDAFVARYPEQLMQRLRGQRREGAFAVLNAGISGNRLLSDGVGPKGIERFRRDVLAQGGVTHVVILIGINDIGLSMPQGSPPVPGPPSADDITAGLQQLVEQAHAAGVKVLLGTLLPFKGAIYWSEEKEQRRQAVNRWIRGRQGVDGVVDFDAVLRDPSDPMSLKPDYDGGDHLHPGKAGQAAMAGAIDLHELAE
jgi:lysophospholipase L1-like esterase